MTAINRSRRPVRVTSCGFKRQDTGGGFFIVIAPEGSTIPGIVASNDSAMAYLPGEDARASFDLSRPIVGWVETATGERCLSKPTTVHDDAGEPDEGDGDG